MSSQPLPSSWNPNQAQPQPQFTDAQLSDGRILRFKGSLNPDELRQKVQSFRAKETAQQNLYANPPGISSPPNPIEQEAQHRLTYSGPGAWPSQESAVKAGSNPAYQAAVGVPLGAAAAYMGGANVIPVTLPFVKQKMAEHPIITAMALQEGIHQARENIPGGKYIPSAAEWAPFFMMPRVEPAAALRTGGKAPPPEPSAGLGNIPVAPPEPVAPRPVRITGPVIESEARKALDYKSPVEPGKPIAQRPIAKLPEGFTPHEGSSALRGSKYNAETREFEYITKDGQHYVRGDVSPAAKEAFDQTLADTGSAGKAWDVLRNHPEGGVGQFKVINGKRIATKPPHAETVTPESEPPAPKIAPRVALPNEDLTPVLQKSLEAARKAKGKAKD